jgi:Uma2 family endonuclease
MATKTSLTIDDFERLPAETVRNRELVDGELIDVSGNTPRHNLVRDSIIAAVREWIARNNGGIAIAEQEYDFNGNAYGPDVSYFSADKKALLDLDKRVQRFVPDLAIEIVSTNDTYTNLMRKTDRYRRAGTSEVWIVSTDPIQIAIDAAAAMRVLRAGDTLTSDLLPGFALAVDDLFRGL